MFTLYASSVLKSQYYAQKPLTIMLHYANIKSVQTSLACKRAWLAFFNEILLKTLFTRSVFQTAISRHKTLISCPVPVDIIRKTFDARREKTKKKKQLTHTRRLHRPVRSLFSSSKESLIESMRMFNVGYTENT